MSSSLNWGILGTGAIARKFAVDLPHSQTGRLVAVGSRSLESALRFAGDFPGSRPFGSYEELLADPNVQAMYISTPHPQHVKWCIAAAEAGKHILCEKPLTLNHAEAMVVAEAARRNGVFLMEAFMYRCHPRTGKIAELVRDGAVGKVLFVRASFTFASTFNAESRLFNNALGGGGILDVGCYASSVVRLVAGAAEGKAFSDPIEVAGVATLCETGVDAVATASLKFPSGILAQVTTGIVVNVGGDLEVYGDKGWLKVATFWRPPGPILIHSYETKATESIESDSNPNLYALEADAFALGLSNPEAVAVPVEDTLGNMRVLDLWRKTGGVIYEAEKPDAPELKLPFSGRPLQFDRWSEVPMGRIAGLEKPVSRLVMGVDNQVTLPHLSAMADDFFERGGNAFDTAWLYGGGLMERLLGRWIENRGVREQVVVTVKGAHSPLCTPEHLMAQFEESLERLRTDHADIYMMHRDNPAVPAGEFVDVLDQFRAAGRIGVYGGSNWTLERLREANEYALRAGRAPFRVVSNNLSLACMVEPVWGGCVSSKGPEWREWLLHNDAALLSWSSQARGHFAPNRTVGAVADDQIVRCWDSEDNRERRERAGVLAREKSISLINVALAYVLSQPFPAFALIGPRTIEETRTALLGASVRLAPAELAWLDLESNIRT